MKDRTNRNKDSGNHSQHPHERTQYRNNLKADGTMHLENELFFVEHKKYPDASVGTRVPEDMSDKAMEIEERLNR